MPELACSRQLAPLKLLTNLLLRGLRHQMRRHSALRTMSARLNSEYFAASGRLRLGT
jgi:hypothetical protein